MLGWLAVVAVSVGTFCAVTTEMLPVGLLTAIGDGLGVSAGTAGLTMTVPGIVAAVAAPALAAGTARFDRRPVLLALVGLLAAANALSAFATAFPVLLAARVLVGVSIGGVWAIAAGLGVRLVPERHAGAATSMIFSGIAVASVLGVPAGTVIGDLGGPRAAFAAVGALALAVLLALALLLPPLPATRPVGLREVPRLLRVPGLRAGLAVTVLVVTGHFAAYTYVRPVLERVAGVGPGMIGTFLLVYGIAGVAGNFAAGTVAARSPRRAAFVLALGLVAATALLALSGRTGAAGAASAVAVVVWGVAYGGVSVTMQTWLLRAVPRAPEAGSALFVASFNAAISLGALAGGRAADAFGVAGVLWLGGGAAALGAVGVLVARSRGG